MTRHIVWIDGVASVMAAAFCLQSWPEALLVTCRTGSEDEVDTDFFKPMSERGARAPLLKVGDLRRAAISIDDAAAKSGKDGESDEVLVDVAASLAAAISLLERGGRKASPSDKMFEHMLSDYRGSLSRARQALSSHSDGWRDD